MCIDVFSLDGHECFVPDISFSDSEESDRDQPLPSGDHGRRGG